MNTTENLQELAGKIEEVKEKLTDEEYKGILEMSAKLYEKKEPKIFVEVIEFVSGKGKLLNKVSRLLEVAGKDVVVFLSETDTKITHGNYLILKRDKYVYFSGTHHKTAIPKVMVLISEKIIK